MQKIQRLVFPALTLCFLLLLGGFFLGRQSRGTAVLTTQYPAAAETGVRAGPSAGTEGAGAPDPAPGEKLDLNKATLEELMQLPGIGEVRARSILDYRAEHGPFQRAADLMQVRGIGEGIFAELRDLIYVEESHENSDH